MEEFQYHTFLYHSQTRSMVSFPRVSFQYHTFLHHSQTYFSLKYLNACFSTIHFYIILKLYPLFTCCFFVSVPYVFTSFSNNCYSLKELDLFQYHTFLHHSQTVTNLVYGQALFQYHTFLHHSQTTYLTVISSVSFQYHTFLHHSQTSNSKMNRHHLRKTRYSNTFNRFHIDLYL